MHTVNPDYRCSCTGGKWKEVFCTSWKYKQLPFPAMYGDKAWTDMKFSCLNLQYKRWATTLKDSRFFDKKSTRLWTKQSTPKHPITTLKKSQWLKLKIIACMNMINIWFKSVDFHEFSNDGEVLCFYLPVEFALALTGFLYIATVAEGIVVFRAIRHTNFIFNLQTWEWYQSNSKVGFRLVHFYDILSLCFISE